MSFMKINMQTASRCLARGFALMLMCGFAAVGSLQAAPFWGASASGLARQFQITCSTCPNGVTTLSNLSDGGFGNTSAEVDLAKPGFVSYFATAVLTGPNSLPHLGASAIADIEIAPPSTFFYAASSVARATQRYTYTGSTATHYTLAYNIDGALAGGDLTEIAGGFTVFGSGFNPEQEVQPILGFTFDHENGDGTEKQVHLSGSVTFSLNPGDSFFVQATLDTFADSRSQSLSALADASHSLGMSFTEGDTSLLVPDAVAPSSSVPEPSSLLLTTAGVAGLLIAGRRRRLPVRSRLESRPFLKDLLKKLGQ